MTRRIDSDPADGARHSLPRVLDRRMIRLRPTGYGLVFLGVLVVMLAGSLRYNNNLGFLLCFLLGSMALVSCRRTRGNLEGIKIVSCSAVAVFAGEPVALDLWADPGPADRFAVSFGFEKTESLTVELPGGARRNLALHSSPMGRGMFYPGPLRVVSRYPIGLFAAHAVLQPDAACVVYPRPISGPVVAVEETRQPPSSGDGQGGAGVDDFQGLKAYEPGDPLQLVSWKTLSRGMGLHTKEFVSTTGGAVCFDWFRLTGMDEEQRLGRLCDMVLGAQRSNRPFGMRLPGETVRPAGGSAHARRCLLQLALFDTGGKARESRPAAGGAYS